MRIGVVSDTHNNLGNVKRIVELFNHHAVDRVVHTGDITQVKTVDLFASLNAPLYGVFGNNDQAELQLLQIATKSHGFHFIQPPLTLTWSGKRIIVLHDPLDVASAPLDDVDVILHGHTHIERIQYDQSRLIFNPGECAGIMPGKNAIGILDLLTMQPEVIKF